MTKVVLTTPASFVNDASAVAQEAANNAALTAAIENTLSRDGTGPNQMLASLDMNSQRVLNLPAPSSGLEPVRLIDVNTATTLAGALSKLNNLSDLTNVGQAKTNLSLVKADVGLGNVDNTSDAAKNSAAVTLTNKTLTAPAITSPTGIVKGDVGLANVDNTSDANKPVSTAQAAAIAAAGTSAWSNTRLAKTAAYSVLNADKTKTIALGGSAFYTLTVNAASGYDANFAIVVLNEDTGRGKTIAVNGLSSFILWPGQSCTIFNQNNVWKVGYPGLWLKAGVTFFVDPVNGSDGNDGLAAGAGNAFQTINNAVNVIYQQVHTQNSSPTISVPAGATVTETINIFGQMTGCNVLLISGNGGPFTWKPVNTSAACCIQVGDNAEIGLTNITFGPNLTANGNYAHIYGHQYGVVDLNTGITFGDANGTRCVYWDYNGQLNVNNGVTYTGNFGNAYIMNGSCLNLNGAQTAVSVVAMSRLIYATLGSSVDVQGNVTTVGTFTGISASLSTNGSIIRNSGGGVVPGGTPTATLGGVYSTTL